MRILPSEKARVASEGQLLISVLMPAYNASKTIDRAIRSTLRALPSNTELLVYLDGCSDKTGEIVSRIQDKRLHTFEVAENRGIVHARNFLLKRARGKYVANMDSDDICLPWRFRTQLKQLDKEPVDLLFTSALILDSSSKLPQIIPQPPVGLSDQDCKIFLTFGNPFVNSSLLAKRDILLSLDGYKPVASEDFDLWLRAAARGFQFRRMAQPCVVYRLSPTQVTAGENWLEGVRAQGPSISKAQKALAVKLGIATKSSSELREFIGGTNREFSFWNVRLAKLVGLFNPRRAKGKLNVE